MNGAGRPAASAATPRYGWFDTFECGLVSVHLEACRAAPNAPLRMGGWIEQITDTGALFRVRAQDAAGVVCEATVRLAIGAPAPARAVTARVVLPVAAMPAYG